MMTSSSEEQMYKVVPAKSLKNNFGEVTIPQNPYLAEDNWNSGHQDSFCSESVGLAGPTGRTLKVIKRLNPYGLGGIMGCNTHDQHVAVCMTGEVGNFSQLVVFDEDCNIISSVRLSEMELGSFAGGYFYLNQNNDAIVILGNKLSCYKTANVIAGDEIKVAWVSEDIVKAVTKRSTVNELYCSMPIWDVENGYWCVISGIYDASAGTVTSNAYIAAVVLDDSGKILQKSALELKNEWCNNVIAVDQKAVYFVTNGDAKGGGHLYAAEYNNRSHKISMRWSSAYNNCGYKKPGQTNNGSGTTPTLFSGGDLVAITDNDEPRMNVVAYNTKDGEKVVEVPVFPKMRSANEASLIGAGNYLVVENNFGHVLYDYNDSQLVSNEPGLVMIEVMPEPNHTGYKSRVIWKDQTHTVFGMSMLARKSGIIYAYRGDWSGEKSATEGPMYYVHAIDSFDGRVIWRVPTGRGNPFRHDYGGIYFNRKGDRIYVGAKDHIISVQTY